MTPYSNPATCLGFGSKPQDTGNWRSSWAALGISFMILMIFSWGRFLEFNSISGLAQIQFPTTFSHFGCAKRRGWRRGRCHVAPRWGTPHLAFEKLGTEVASNMLGDVGTPETSKKPTKLSLPDGFPQCFDHIFLPNTTRWPGYDWLPMACYPKHRCEYLQYTS